MHYHTHEKRKRHGHHIKDRKINSQTDKQLKTSVEDAKRNWITNSKDEGFCESAEKDK